LILLGLFSISSAVVAVTAGPDPVVASEWKSHDVKVDGRIADWSRLTALDKGPALAAAESGILALVSRANLPYMGARGRPRLPVLPDLGGPRATLFKSNVASSG